MREKVVFKTITATPDGQGGSTEALETLTTMWAKVEPLTAVRALEYQQITGSQGYVITVNYRSDITKDNVLEWNSLTLSIVSVKMTNENRKQLIILAQNKV